MLGQRKQPSFSWDQNGDDWSPLGLVLGRGNLWIKACSSSISGPGCSPTMFNRLVGTTEYVLYNNGVEDSQRLGWATGHGFLWGSSDLCDSTPGLQLVGLPKTSSGFSWQPILRHWYTPGQHDQLVDHKSGQVRLTSLAREQLSRSTLWGTPLVPRQHQHIRAERLESDSFEPAEWSERLTPWQSGWLGAATVGSIPALAFSLFLQRLYFLLFLQRLYLSLRAVRSAAVLLFVLRRFVLAASSACFFPFFLPPPNPQSTVSVRT